MTAAAAVSFAASTFFAASCLSKQPVTAIAEPKTNAANVNFFILNLQVKGFIFAKHYCFEARSLRYFSKKEIGKNKIYKTSYLNWEKSYITL